MRLNNEAWGATVLAALQGQTVREEMIFFDVLPSHYIYMADESPPTVCLAKLLIWMIMVL